MPPSPSPASRFAIAVMAAVMLLVPLGIVLLVRSVIPDWSHPADHLGTPAPASPAPRPEEGRPRVRGKVLDENGNPVGGADVHLLATTAPPTVLASAKTNAAGAFDFADASPGEARVAVEHDPEGIASAAVSVAEETPTDVVLVLSAAEAITGTVVDTDDHPIAGATITATGAPWTVAAATSDSTGTFRMTVAPHEATSLVAVARGYATASASLAARAQSTQPSPHVVQLRMQAGAPIEGDVVDPDGHPVMARVTACEGERYGAETRSAEDGTFTLPPTTAGCAAAAFRNGFAPSEEVVLGAGRVTLRLQTGGSIDGVVVDERGSGVSPVVVAVESYVPARGRRTGRGPSQKSDDPSGAFHLESLAPGTYVLTATTDGKPPARSEPIAVSAGTPTRGVRIVLGAGGIVVGHVYDDKREPVAGVELGFDQVSSVAVSRARATTDDRGAYRLEGAPLGAFTLMASKRGYRTVMTAGLHVEGGATLTQDVTMNGSDGGGLELGGIGATLEQTGNGVILRDVFPGDPADKAGLRSNDFLLRIDGEPTDGMSMADVLQRLRGTPGTTVGVSVRRGGGDHETFDAVVVRATVVH